MTETPPSDVDKPPKFYVDHYLGEDTTRYAIKNPSEENRQGRRLLTEAETQEGIEQPFAGPVARKRIEFSEFNPGQPIWIGADTRTGQDVGIPRDRFFQHLLLLGSTGYGKTTILNNIHLQLILSNTGLAIIDGKGDNAPALVDIIPESRMSDLIYLDVGGATDYASGFNYLNTSRVPSDPTYEQLVRYIVRNLTILLEVEDTVSNRFENILTETVDAMNRGDHNYTLADLYTILTNGKALRRFNKAVTATDTQVNSALDNLETIPEEERDAFINSLKDILQNKSVRRLINQRNSDLEIGEAIDNNKIMVFRLTGDTSTRRQLGTAFLRRIWAVIRSRSETDVADRDPYFISIDEGQNVVRSDNTLTEMLREARGYKAGVLYSTQNLIGIPEDTAKQLYANSETMLSFNVGDSEEAERIGGMLDIEGSTLTQESRYHLWMQMDLPEKGQRTEPIRVYAYPPYPPHRNKMTRNDIIKQNIEQHGSKIEDMSSFAPITDLSIFHT